MMLETALALTMMVPAAGAALIWMSAGRPNQREGVTLVTATTLFALVVYIVIGVLDGAQPAFELLAVMPGLPVAFSIEPLGMLFALIASFLWLVTSVYSIGYMRANKEGHQTRYYVFFAIALAATMGIAFADNMFTLFLAYEVLTLSTYPLVAHHGTAEAVRGARIYLGLLLATSIALLLTGIIATWAMTGTLDFRSGGIIDGQVPDELVGVLLALYMFGIGKAALMPFHRWLPAAMVAPTPVSALLHAVAVVKAGVFTALKVIVYIFGIDLLDTTGASDWLAYVAAITLVLASVIALTKDNLKARLAYSTVSQLAYVVLGGALASKWGVIGGGMHIAMHAFGKITLFFCAGAIYTALHKTEISDMAGIGRVMPVTMTAFLIGALSVAGLPPGGGSWSKWYLTLAALDDERFILVAALMLSTLLNVAYFMPIVARAWFVPVPRPASAGAAAAPGTPLPDGVREAPAACLLPLCLTAAGCVALFLAGDLVYAFLSPLAAG